MKAHGNGNPETCASNLLRIVRGEVPYDRVRGRDGALVDQPNATDEAAADAEWVLETYEPRVNAESITGSGEALTERRTRKDERAIFHRSGRRARK